MIRSIKTIMRQDREPYRGGNHQGINNLRCRTKEVPDCRTDQRNHHHHRYKYG